MEQKGFFFDIDGTLYDPIHKVCASTKLAIKKLQEAGHLCAIATGRSFIGSKDIAEELGIDTIVCDGGNSVYINNQVAYSKSLDVSFVEALVRYCIEHQLSYTVMNNDQYFGISKMEQMELTHPWISYGGKQPTSFEHIMKVGIIVDEGHMQAIIDQFPCHFYVFKHCMFMVTDQDNKHLGITKCKELLHYTKEHVVFGDSFNDIKMFEGADYAICMGQAPLDVQKKADYVTDSIQEDGIYNACIALGYFGDEYA